MEQAYKIEQPDSPSPLVLDSPHSGSHYPKQFLDLATIDEAALRRYEDNYVCDLFSGAPALGAAFLKAHFPRIMIDVNRTADDIDPAMLVDPWPVNEYGPINPTHRSLRGIGLLRRDLNNAYKKLYKRKLYAEEVKHWIDQYYTPYHAALEGLVEKAQHTFGAAWHINCHSMPSSSSIPYNPRTACSGIGGAVDFCIGDRDGSTASIEFREVVRDFLRKRGYRVSINDPYKGVEIVRRYGAPMAGRQSLQLEINKALYMDERTGEKKAYTYKRIKQDMHDLTAHVMDHIDAQLVPLAAD